jgi:hypothetical protein
MATTPNLDFYIGVIAPALIAPSAATFGNLAIAFVAFCERAVTARRHPRHARLRNSRQAGRAEKSSNWRATVGLAGPISAGGYAPRRPPLSTPAPTRRVGSPYIGGAAEGSVRR